MTDVISDAGSFYDLETGESTMETDLTATETPKDDDGAMHFHVQMRNYSVQDVEAMVVEAAAIKLVEGWNDKDLSKRIQDRAIELITAKIDAKLETITNEILEQPVNAKLGQTPVTMAEFIGLRARDYLTAKVDREGRPVQSIHDRGQPRIQHIVDQVFARGFDTELRKASDAGIEEARAAILAEQKRIVNEQSDRFIKALELTAKGGWPLPDKKKAG